MTSQPVIAMTQADRDLIQRFLDEKRRSPINTPGRGREGETEHEEWLTPEVYVARVADDGIPALIGSADESVIGNDGDIPGYADCYIYRISVATGVPKLRKVSPAKKRVYNLFGSIIDSVPWIPVMRDKFGSWLAMGGGTVDVGTGTDTNEPYCGYLILNCQDVVTEPCCDTAGMASTATLTYKIGSLAPATLALTKVGDGHSGEHVCDVGDGHTEVHISYLTNCFPDAGYVAIGFSVSVYVDSSLENHVEWNDTFTLGEINDKGYMTCTPYSLHYEGLNTGGVFAFTNPRNCGSVDYPFAAAGGLLVTLDVVE